MKRILASLLLLLTLATPASAQLGTVPHTFTTGDNLISDLNENFSTAFANALNRTGGTMTGTLTSQGLVPVSTASYDLGSSLVKYRDLFLSRNLDVAGNFALTGTLSDPDSAVNIADQLAVTTTSVPQAQLKYDGSDYLEFSVSSVGVVTINAVGPSQSFTFQDNVSITGALSVSSFVGSNITGTSTTFSDTVPTLNFSETDAGADAKNWRFIVNSGGFNFQTVNDAGSVANNIWTVSRTGATVNSFNIVAAQTLIAAGSITAPSLALSANTKAGLYSTSGGIVLSAQDASAGAGDDAGFFVTATTSGGDVSLSVGNGTSGNTNYRWLSSRFDLTNGNPFIQLGRVAFASLPTPTDNGGALIYCTDCAVANPCAAAGTGALAKRVNSVWVCN